MNGAAGELPKKIKAPRINVTRTIGNNHHFLLFLRNNQNSDSKLVRSDIPLLLEKMLVVIFIFDGRMLVPVTGAGRIGLAPAQRIATSDFENESHGH